ncbi:MULTISPECIES: hypothetical protein [unclassified Oceanispirochaeta]|uniref:hypothetical protein n=1 Tax=unclassified Oceanispirochaeta TaxID=2635722 RepID=UPI000E08FCA5|nr:MULTISPECIES: hypothetical protein [unclassified Oceanispirochaeta]MBF9017645.1 hypothetical protein [Oceanispirochaeta sp. M2]NPD74217.1 hypothetical protein [Oceanispirochaeta sp. M1]RDG29923.1 hypothetical protein DV872_19135 [Oceanispirochaeta sp. M1]
MALIKDIHPDVLEHLQLLAEKYGEPGDKYIKSLSRAWHKKEKIFMKQVKTYHMTIETEIRKDERRAFILLTFSGSILGAGPASEDGSRQIIYASIGERKDVPEKLLEDNMILKSAVKLDKEASFSGGSFKRSSPVYKIALMNSGPAASQTKQLEDATRIMTKEFVSINNTIIPD